MPLDYAIDEEFFQLAKELTDETIPTPNATWLKHSEPQIPDANKPWLKSAATQTVFPCKIVFDRDKLEDRQLRKFKMIRDAVGRLQTTEVLDGQVNGWMYPQGFEPTVNDTVNWNNQTLTVKAIDPIQVVKDVIIYFIEFGL